MSVYIDPPSSLMEDQEPVCTEPSEDWYIRANKELDRYADLPFLQPPHSKVMNLLLRLERAIHWPDETKLIESLKGLDPSAFDRWLASMGEWAKENPWYFVRVHQLRVPTALFAVALDLYRNNIDCDLSEQIFLSLADLGHEFSQCYYADILRLRGEMTMAIPYYQQAANHGDDVALYNMAYSLYKGDGQEQDLELAKEYFKLAADSGHSDAQYAYGILIRDSDPYEAAIYLKLASDFGLGDAMCSYGDLLDKYFDDHETALRYWQRAWDEEYYRALDSIGSSYYRKYIQAIEEWKDYEADVYMARAVSYWKMAAELGDPLGRHHYGWALKVGFGVAKNYEEAIHYLNQAADGGVSESFVDLAEILFAQGKKKEAQRLLEEAQQRDRSFEFVGGYQDCPEDGLKSLQSMGGLSR